MQKRHRKRLSINSSPFNRVVSIMEKGLPSVNIILIKIGQMVSIATIVNYKYHESFVFHTFISSQHLVLCCFASSRSTASSSSQALAAAILCFFFFSHLREQQMLTPITTRKMMRAMIDSNILGENVTSMTTPKKDTEAHHGFK